jgi:hypothetical protein
MRGREIKLSRQPEVSRQSFDRDCKGLRFEAEGKPKVGGWRLKVNQRLEVGGLRQISADRKSFFASDL